MNTRFGKIENGKLVFAPSVISLEINKLYPMMRVFTCDTATNK